MRDTISQKFPKILRNIFLYVKKLVYIKTNQMEHNTTIHKILFDIRHTCKTIRLSLELRRPRHILPIDQDGFRHAIKFSFVSPRSIDQHAL